MCQPYCEHFQLHIILAIGLDYVVEVFHYSKYFIHLCKLTPHPVAKPWQNHLLRTWQIIFWRFLCSNKGSMLIHQSRIFSLRNWGTTLLPHRTYICIQILSWQYTFFIAKVFGIRNSCLLSEYRGNGRSRDHQKSSFQPTALWNRLFIPTYKSMLHYLQNRAIYQTLLEINDCCWTCSLVPSGICLLLINCNAILRPLASCASDAQSWQPSIETIEQYTRLAPSLHIHFQSNTQSRFDFIVPTYEDLTYNFSPLQCHLNKLQSNCPSTSLLSENHQQWRDDEFEV